MCMHAVAVGVDADLRLELGDVGLPLAAHVHAEGLVDVVVELRHAAEVVLEAVVAGVDDQGHAEHDDQREDAREQEAAGLSGRHPTAGARRPLHLLRGAGLTHRVAHPTRGVCADPFGPRPVSGGSAAGRPPGRAARTRSRSPRSCTPAARARPAEARRARSAGSARRSPIASPQALGRPDRDQAAGVADDLRQRRRVGGDDRGAGRHRLEGREAEALVARRHGHDVGQLEQTR